MLINSGEFVLVMHCKEMNGIMSVVDVHAPWHKHNLLLRVKSFSDCKLLAEKGPLLLRAI